MIIFIKKKTRLFFLYSFFRMINTVKHSVLKSSDTYINVNFCSGNSISSCFQINRKKTCNQSVNMVSLNLIPQKSILKVNEITLTKKQLMILQLQYRILIARFPCCTLIGGFFFLNGAEHLLKTQLCSVPLPFHVHS